MCRPQIAARRRGRSKKTAAPRDVAALAGVSALARTPDLHDPFAARRVFYIQVVTLFAIQPPSLSGGGAAWGMGVY